MKRVNFDTAKALKEAGYPQISKLGYREGESLISYPLDGIEFYSAPFYMEAWLWLWREKGICIDWKDGYIYVKGEEFDCFNDPEEAIMQAIEYLVEQKLLK